MTGEEMEAAIVALQERVAALEQRAPADARQVRINDRVLVRLAFNSDQPAEWMTARVTKQVTDYDADGYPIVSLAVDWQRGQAATTRGLIGVQHGTAVGQWALPSEVLGERE